MSLLLDNNLSYRLTKMLQPVFPGICHLQKHLPETASDKDVRACAIANGLAIVTKDDDHRDHVLTHGAPPKVIWLQLGNKSTQQIAAVLTAHKADIDGFLAGEELALLIISAH